MQLMTIFVDQSIFACRVHRSNYGSTLSLSAESLWVLCLAVFFNCPERFKSLRIETTVLGISKT